jgi:hypothetical protein
MDNICQANWGYQEFLVVFVYSDGLKLGPHGYMRKGGTAGTSELLYPNYGNVPIRKFYLRNGPHLTDEGTSVFVTNKKFNMKKVLHIEVTRPKQNGFRAGQRHNVNMLNILLFSSCSVIARKGRDRIILANLQ